MDTPVESRSETMFDKIGGATKVRHIVDCFYDIMDTEPRAANVRKMHSADLQPMRQRLFEFLMAWLGGPRDYFMRPGSTCIMAVHAPFAIGTAERDEWLVCMKRALEESDLPASEGALIYARLTQMADAFRNR